MQEMDELSLQLMRWHHEKLENDIQYMAEYFESESKNWTCLEEADAWYAQLEINKAQRKISELKLEIEKQEALITQSERVIRRFKSVSKEIKSTKGKGRPESDEFRVSIGKKFVSKWVLSLMEILEVKSCQKLEQLISPHSKKLETDKVTKVLTEITVPSKASERNWRRWQKGEAIPNYNTFVILMSTRIDFGKYSGKLLQDIPTTPSSSELQTLLRFI
ncbi:hypothetical protein SAMN05192566_1538 [Methylophilus rhizosphaerae]|uniref:Uncharacterized protein n=1 Tax=Methylophilus rhizosphaerae TaxID=492660 RepID=A0A1G9CNB5_9PROT|nr:hypothetical protein [Methylophilus rhizosphaerae]SDK52935.1 hypothetical protein SAMN05192566_1538 [Methylophilus rhizosphaerae]